MENGAPDTVEKKPIVNPDSLAKGPPAKPPYSAFSPARRRFILIIVTVAGFYGPLSGSIYLPALPVLERAFDVSTQVINATVSVFMAILAVAVRPDPLYHAPVTRLSLVATGRIDADLSDYSHCFGLPGATSAGAKSCIWHLC
jgi:hypothetical protein